MGVLSNIKKGLIEVWPDIYDARWDDKAAPDLGDLVKREEDPIYSNSKEFFNRTYLTKSIENLIEDIAETLKSSKGGSIYLLTSLFGGGKTHTQIALFHAFSNPETLKEVNERLAAKIAEAGKPLIIVIDGSRVDLAPHPNEPYKVDGFTIKTIWGMLAHKLGLYLKIKHLDNEKAAAPDVTLLQKILSEIKEPVLILMDEIIHYIFNMDKSQGLKDYADHVLLFLDYLARAIERTPKVVLVASIQAEYRIIAGQKKLLEEEIFSGYAGKVLANLNRESTKIVVPVSPDDIALVLQKRIFKKVPEQETWAAKDELYKKYREFPDIFGEESHWEISTETGRSATAKDTYPFHPKYIEVLQEFVTRNRDLQKTRDAIRITRKVVRKLLRGNKDTSFIMPWHIDLKDKDIRTRILTESHREFRDVVSRDIVSEEGHLGSVAECSKKELAYMIATSIFLKTYTYESFKQPLKVFPDITDTALMVYDDETFKTQGLIPQDIKDTLAEMVNRLPHFTSESGRYWFTPYPSVIEYVDKKAAEILRDSKFELYSIITKIAEEILTRKEKRIIEESGQIFEKEKTRVIGYVNGDFLKDFTIEDEPSPKLFVFVKPEINEDEIRTILFMKGKEGRRTYRNTIVIVYPRQSKDFETLLSLASKIKSAQEVKDSLIEYFKDKDLLELQAKKLSNYMEGNERNLKEHLLSTLTSIAYPGSEAGNDIPKYTTTTAESSIISQVEAGLKNPATGPKLRTQLSFKDIAEFLKRNQNWDIIEGTSRYTFRNIIDTFYTVTLAPLTSRSVIEIAIRGGLESFDIGIIMDGKLYWKEIGSSNPPELPSKIKDDAEIIPYKIAAKILNENLSKESGLKIRDGEKVEIWYEVELNGQRIKLENLASQHDWEKILKHGIIYKNERKIETGFILTLNPSSLRIAAGERAEVKVSITPIDSYDSLIRIDVDRGKATPDRGKAPFDLIWDLGVLKEVGVHEFKIKAISDDGKEYSSTLTIIVESGEELIETKKLDLNHVGAKLIYIQPLNLTALQIAAETLSKLNQEATLPRLFVSLGGIIQFSGGDIDSKLITFLVQKLREISMTLNLSETSLEGTLKLKQPIILDSLKITNFAPLSERAVFKLSVVKK